MALRLGLCATHASIVALGLDERVSYRADRDIMAMRTFDRAFRFAEPSSVSSPRGIRRLQAWNFAILLLASAQILRYLGTVRPS